MTVNRQMYGVARGILGGILCRSFGLLTRQRRSNENNGDETHCSQMHPEVDIPR